MPQRTLVLVNGRRLMPGDPTRGRHRSVGHQSDSDDLIERVDMLTGGASAVYGADAVAGVVNFVMNDHFEGVRVDANDGFFNHWRARAAAMSASPGGGLQTAPTGSDRDGNTEQVTAILG